jgi:hypothetical protein
MNKYITLTYRNQADILFGMKKKQTTMRFTEQDLAAIVRIREQYGCISDVAAVRLALQIVARKGDGKEKRPAGRGNSSPA